MLRSGWQLFLFTSIKRNIIVIKDRNRETKEKRSQTAQKCERINPGADNKLCFHLHMLSIQGAVFFFIFILFLSLHIYIEHSEMTIKDGQDQGIILK